MHYFLATAWLPPREQFPISKLHLFILTKVNRQIHKNQVRNFRFSNSSHNLRTEATTPHAHYISHYSLVTSRGI
jgi:hypothetical protein